MYLILLGFVSFCNVKPTQGVLALLSSVNSSSSEAATGSLVVSAISGNINEFGVRANFTVALSENPEKSVYLCLESSDTANGGTIVESAPVFSASTPCNKSYLEFSPTGGTVPQTVTIEGARGTVGVQTDTSYTISISSSTEDSSFKNLSTVTVGVINKNIDIPGYYFVRVFIKNLNGNLILKNNGSETLSLNSSGYNNFATALTDLSAYSVSVVTQPSTQVCSVEGSPFGNLASAHAVVTFDCVSGFVFNGTLFSTPNPPTLNQSFASLVTLSGDGTSGSNNGIGTAAHFNNPIAIATDGQNLFLADLTSNLIRKQNLGDNSVTTLAANPGPHGIATDGVNVYVTSYNNHTVNKINISTGTITLMAGAAGVSGDVDGGIGTSRLNTPTYLTTDGINLFVTDRANNKIKKIVIATGVTSSLSVTGMNNANGITTDGNDLYIANSGNHTILKYNLTSSLQSIVAGTGASGNSDNSTGISATLDSPYGLTMDGSFLYLLEGSGKSFRKMSLSSPNGITTIATPQSAGLLDGTIGIPGTSRFCNASNCDTSITTDGNFIFFSDRHNHSIRKILY
ncbi:hypothetical protein [Leptospira ilyithenensis]|uniref:SMP-30/Gluconolactonase/LRE-like region domain-containing protein n=1 Tax=Leptospira ilyithenensis TaxID=2484901 RepID=A0A4V3JWZ6_9LEPT|nr:hypothetical protein [Leptospira ilyithenensis]TGN09152.1 hypothetical protein EHS11_13020 [Leptospira ilyithenensis]